MINPNKESFSEGPGDQKGRPNFGTNQVRDLSEIKPGMVLVARRHDAPHIYGETLMTIGFPFQRDNSWWICARSFSSRLVDWSTRHNISLVDHGVVPYSNGLWNPSNWLENPFKVANPDKKP